MPREYTRRPVYDRVMDKVAVRDGHWIWTGSTGSSGYGFVNSGGRRGTHLSVTHVVWEHHHGPVPEGLVLDHLECCLIITCCNPDHLEPVTQAENRRRQTLRRTACNQGHEYPPDVTWGKHGRVCLPCHAERERKVRERKRQRFAEVCPNGHVRTPENTEPGMRCHDCTSEAAVRRWAAFRDKGSG